MASRAVLTAIARAVDRGGQIDEAFAALSRVDPLLRSGARRRLREAYADAVLATPRSSQGEEGALHLMRVTYLHAAGAAPGPDQIEDAVAVAATYEAARAGAKPPPPRIWWATALLAIAVAIGAGAIVLAVVRAPGSPPRADASQRAAVAPGGAYRDGGRPDANALVSRALERDVPGYLIALDRWSEVRRRGGSAAELTSVEEALAQARAGALAPDVRAAFGERAARRLEELLASARAAAESPAGPTGDAAADALMQSLGALNDELTGAGLGYFVDGDVIERADGDRRLVIIYTFSVEGVTLFQVTRGATPARPESDNLVRSLHLRRLDHLNWTHTLLGFTRPHLREAVVLLDQVDENLVTYVLPGLGPDASVQLFDDDDAAAPPSAAAVCARAGELVRAEYAAAPGLDRAAAARLGLRLSRRRALFDGWQARVRARGVTVQEPTTLTLGLDYGKALRGLVPDAELDELAAIDGELGDAHIAEVYAQLREVLVRSVERHEVQHRSDFSRDDPGFMPKTLARYVGPAEKGGEERRHASLARDELSAYLAELARDEWTPRVNLSMLSRFLFKRRMWGTPECYAAIVMLEGLAAELSIPIPEGALLHAGQIDREAVAAVYLAITLREGTDLRAAARRLWETLFEANLPRLTRL